MRKRDPKVGTGKKPKKSGRRLYTDENPKDTVSIKFATPTDARNTVAKVKRINKPYARKIQILTVMEQRAKVMGKTQVVSIAKKQKRLWREREKLAKINILIPELNEDYVVQNQRQITYGIETLVNQLNFAYQNDLKNEQDAFNFFMSWWRYNTKIKGFH